MSNTSNSFKSWWMQRFHNVYLAVSDELKHTWREIRSTKVNALFALALLCCVFVLVGNVIILISYNLWLVSFPEVQLVHNSSQIAIQVVEMLLLMMFFTILFVAFVMYYGIAPIWHVMVDTNRIRGPWYRLLMMFLSGFSNAFTGLLATYSMTYTPQFIQAVLLCSIPFSAQAWTVVFIPEERQRNYLSLFFIISFMLFIGGALLSSLWDFVHPGENGYHTPWSWTLIYIASCIVFGFWCVVQRLYLDAIIVKDSDNATNETDTCVKSADLIGKKVSKAHEPVTHPDHLSCCSFSVTNANAPRQSHRREGDSSNDNKNENENDNDNQALDIAEYAAASATADKMDKQADDNGNEEQHVNHNMPIVIDKNNNNLTGINNVTIQNQDGKDDDDDDEEVDGEVHATTQLLAEKREWGRSDVDSMASKLMLIYVGITFQTIFSLLQFPADAIPWYGTSTSVLAAWRGFCESFNFTFDNWRIMRFGLLNALGYAMSFIGCTFLNENSPTLASVVLQLAGPVTSLVLIIHPQWNVFGQINYVGFKLGGVILLIIAAIFYHFWEQRSMRLLLQKVHGAKTQQELHV